MNSTEDILSHAANNVLIYALKCNLSIAVFYYDVKQSVLFDVFSNVCFITYGLFEFSLLTEYVLQVWRVD